jgi:hypothetical protein
MHGQTDTSWYEKGNHERNRDQHSLSTVLLSHMFEVAMGQPWHGTAYYLHSHRYKYVLGNSVANNCDVAVLHVLELDPSRYNP